MPVDWLIPAIGLAAALAVIWPFLRRQRRLERAGHEAEIEALRYGLDQPATLHPVVDSTRCIGSGNCVDVCPEGDVLALVAGQARAVGPAMCIGHGLCERRCPVDAIQLVFGTDRRGVDLPRIKENFETNVPGLYVIGELGGMGLIGNAVEQGRQCIEGIHRTLDSGRDPNLTDLVIVGCGPAGLSASLAAREAGLRCVTIEKEDVGGTVRHYPRKKMVLTRPVELPAYGKLQFREIVKEELIDLWETVVDDAGLEVSTGETVQAVQRLEPSGFEVVTSRRTVRAHEVILAIGRRGVPRKLDVPGEELPKVSYSLREPDAFRGDRVLVVGGGDSAVEAALALSDDSSNDVKISYRRDRFRRVKPANRERVERALDEGRIEVLWSTNVTAIEPDRVLLTNGQSEPLRIVNDYTFIFAGGELPTAFLQRCGVQIDTKFGEP